jgi:hypothetical protein
MTLVARFAIQGCPMLMGDLLLSIDDVSATPAPIPTIDDLSKIFPVGSPTVPAGLAQKLAVISDTFVLGWAGTQPTARDVIAELKERNGRDPFTRDSLMEFLDAYNDSVWNEIGLVGFIEDSAGMTQFACDRTVVFQSPAFGTVALLGSGTTAVRDMLENDIQSLPTVLDGAANVTAMSVGAGLFLSGALLNFEMATIDNLNDMYGAGYEIATVLNQRFAKVDDITYLFWRADVHGQRILVSRLPLSVCRYSYHDDILVIRSAKFDDRGDARAFDQRVFAVSPVYRHIAQSELTAITLPNLNARYLCNYFFVPLGGQMAVLAFVTYRERADDERWIKFEEHDGEVNVGVERQFIMNVIKELLECPDSRSDGTTS